MAKLSDAELGDRLARAYLTHCQDAGATGTAVLNGVGNILISLFAVVEFENKADRLKEFDNFFSELRKEVNRGNR